MIRLATTKATVIGCAVLLLTAALSSCTDATGLTGADSGLGTAAETTFRRGSTGPGKTDWKNQVASLEVKPDTFAVAVDSVVPLTVVARNRVGQEISPGAVTWRSADTSIVAVHDSAARGRHQGATFVSATVNGITDSARVMVTAAGLTVDSIALSPDSAQIVVGGGIKLGAHVFASDGTEMPGTTVTWAASNPAVASVSGTGTVTGASVGTTTILASASGVVATATLEVTAASTPVSVVAVSPGSVSLAVGQTSQLSATPRDAGGSAISGLAMTWASSSAAVATVSSTGLVTAKAQGSATITATVDGVSGSSTVTVASSSSTPTADRVGYYVSPNGSSGAAGTRSSPWDLASVLSGSRNVRPGDTVWVLGGTYRGAFVNYLNGSPSQQVVVRQYPGARATIDGYLVVLGSYVTFQGLEVMNSNPTATHRIGVDVKAPGSRMVNLVVHDAGASGVGMWNEAPDAELYGSIIYNNGTVANQDHGVYFNGNSGTKFLSDNIVFDNWQYGFHGYSSISGEVRNLRLDGNVSFNNGSVGPNGHGPDYFVGGSSAVNIAVTNNLAWRRNDGELALRLGDGQGGNNGLTLTGNYMVGGTLIGSFTNLVSTGNTFLSSASPPTSGQRVVVRPNRYEDGRANIVVYNWSGLGSASADVAGVLRAGDAYEVRDAQDFYGAPVLQGTYSGGTLSIPMTAVRPPALIGRSGNDPGTTGTVFHVYVLLRTN